MLVLSRYRDEVIRIGKDIAVTVLDIRGDKVRLGIEAPPNIEVDRQEIYDQKQKYEKSYQAVTQTPVVLEGLRPEFAEVDQATPPNLDNLTDMEWLESQKVNFPKVGTTTDNGWLVSVAPHVWTRGTGKTFIAALSVCRRLSVEYDNRSQGTGRTQP